MPQTILRNAVRSAAPAATTIGATDLPLSHRLQSDKKILRSSAMLRFSIGLEPFTITTMGSPAPAAGTTSNRDMARIPAARNPNFACIVIALTSEGERKLGCNLIPARFAASRIAVILQLYPCILRQLITKSGGEVLLSSYRWGSIGSVINRVMVVGVLPRISHVRPIAVKSSRELRVKRRHVEDCPADLGIADQHAFAQHS